MLLPMLIPIGVNSNFATKLVSIVDVLYYGYDMIEIQICIG